MTAPPAPLPYATDRTRRRRPWHWLDYAFLAVIAAATVTIAALLVKEWPRPRFDVDEPLPALAGVRSTLGLLGAREWQSRGGSPGEVVVTETIRNDSPHELAVYTRPASEVTKIVVRDAGGAEAGRIGGRPWYAAWTRPNRTGVGGFRLGPGDERTLSFAVSRRYDLTEPGAYTVEISTRYRLADGERTPYRTTPEPLKVIVANPNARLEAKTR